MLMLVTGLDFAPDESFAEIKLEIRSDSCVIQCTDSSNHTESFLAQSPEGKSLPSA